jgi:Peptidase family M48
LRSRIVVSAGTLELLDQAELAAVLAHERAHLRERHDLVLLPFTALLRAFRWSPAARDAAGSVALLLEMLADDHAVGYVAAAAAAGGRGRGRQRPARPLAMALLRVGAAGPGTVPCGALAVADGGDVAVRVARLLAPPPGLRAAALVLVGCTAAALVAVPAAFLLLSF